MLHKNHGVNSYFCWKQAALKTDIHESVYVLVLEEFSIERLENNEYCTANINNENLRKVH